MVSLLWPQWLSASRIFLEPCPYSCRNTVPPISCTPSKHPLNTAQQQLLHMVATLCSSGLTTNVTFSEWPSTSSRVLTHPHPPATLPLMPCFSVFSTLDCLRKFSCLCVYSLSLLLEYMLHVGRTLVCLETGTVTPAPDPMEGRKGGRAGQPMV